MIDPDKAKKLVRARPGGIEILDDELFKKIEKGNLSASMVNSLLACPADWVLDKYIVPLLESEEQIHLERGTLFHSIMEHFFRVPQEYRNAKVLGAITQEVTKNEHPHLMQDEDTKAWVKNAVFGYLSMGFDFQNEKIPTITLPNGKSQYGLELLVNGTLTKDKRRIVGFIDKIVEKEVNGEPKLFIEDWKTGKTVHKYDPDKPVSSNNSFDYWRQQALYAYLLEQQGIEVEGASLIFPVAKKVVEVDFKRPDVRNRVIEDMEITEKRLQDCLDKNFFPFTPDIFCTWCHLLYAGRKKGRARYPKVNQNELNLIMDFQDY